MGHIARWKFPEVGFHNLEFSIRPVSCKSRDGRQGYRWIPFGMPQIKPDLEKSVFFTFGIHPKTGEIRGPGGSGVIVARRSDDNVFAHYYAVTNWHVAKMLGNSIIRLNMLDGQTRLLEFSPEEWCHIPASDDLAAIDITDHLDLAIDDVVPVPEREGFVDLEFMKKFNLGFGEDIFMLGMFANSAGEDINLPVARFGNISRLADERAPIEQWTGASRPCHLTDMRSRTGFSGSPVFVYRTPSAELLDVHEHGWGMHPIQNYFLKLLGVHCGQFSETIEATKAKAEARGDPIVEGDGLESPSAMNTVAPAWSITELLDQPSFEKIRMARDVLRKAGAAKIARPEAVSEPPTTDENPDHREDFSRLLDAAVPENKSDR